MINKGKSYLAVIGFLLLLIMTGCGEKEAEAEAVEVAYSVDLMKGIQAKGRTRADRKTIIAGQEAVTDFSTQLLQQSLSEDGNTLVSPLSVLCALGMVANGAEGETLAQIEETIGLDLEHLNIWLADYCASLPDGEKYRLRLANSLWLKDMEDFQVEKDFLNANAGYYGAGLYQSPFDETTVEEINLWVSKRTDGAVNDVLQELSRDDVMCLVNAIAFEAEWKQTYETYEVYEGTFTKENGMKQKAVMMTSVEGAYIEDEQTKGFIKYYDGEKYAFVALLPDKSISIADYVGSLNGERIRSMLANVETKNIIINAEIPKFECSYNMEMSKILQDMGIATAFDEVRADFTGIGTCTGRNLAIGGVLQKNCIAVNERGSKAGVATVIEAVGVASEEMETEIKEIDIFLNRPFVYMIVDSEQKIPIFIGCMMDINDK